MKAEVERRQKVKSDRWTKFEGKPVEFVQDGLLGFLWSKQKTILEALHAKRKVAVPSCHDVGKSYLAAAAACHWLSSFPFGEAFVVTLAPTAHQVKAILWREIGRIHRRAGLPGYVTQTEWKTSQAQGELIGFGRSPKDEDGTAIQGIHQKYVLVIYDEACGISKTLFDAADTLAANELSAQLAIGNPDDPSTEFATICKPGSGWEVIPISAYESPNLTGEVVPDWLRHLLVSPKWCEDRKRKWGESSPIYQSKVLGKFPVESKDGLIPLTAIASAINRDLDYGLPDELGVDVARFGDNFTVGYRRRGPVAQRVFRYQGKDTMVTVGHIMKTLKDNPTIDRVKIDDTGVGGGVTDRLNEMKRGVGCSIEERNRLMRTSIVGVNVGSAPTVITRQKKNDPDAKLKEREKFTETEKFFNLRAQLNWAMRERFIDGAISLLNPLDEPNQPDEDLQAQAADIRYTLTSRGQIEIERKEDMVKRGRASPDDWDAIVLAFGENLIDPVLDRWAALGRRP